MVARAITQTVNEVMNGSRKATKFLSPILVIKASRRFPPRKGAPIVDLVLTIGKPNYEERRFIAQAKKAGEPFPIKKVQLKPWPARRR